MQELVQSPTFFEYEVLPQTPPLTPEYVAVLDSLMTGSWTDGFQCVTALRSIIKYNPAMAADVICRYSNSILEFIGNGKTQLVKNALYLIKETFALGKHVNVEKCVDPFIRVLIKKSAH